MNYQETIQWMFDKLPMYQRIGASAYKADLNNTILLLELLEQPQQQFKTVHIAGTNGKGSVSHMLAAVFQEAGYKTGLYTSPHLKDFRERIRINGEMIPEDEVVSFIEKYKADFDTIELSFFEMTVGMAFYHFRKHAVDIAIIETGMGGRLDSTNLVTPELSIITNIGFDHMQFLGNTLESIATEKAGIIKNGIPVVIGETQPEIKDVFEQFASKHQSEIVFADKQFDASLLSKSNDEYQYFDVWKDSQLFLEELKLPLLGRYQRKNLITTVCALDLLSKRFSMTKEDMREGLSEVIRLTGLRGRWQVLQRHPLCIADAGHNIDGIKQVVNQLSELRYDSLHFILGMVNDKSINEMLQCLPRQAIYYFCKADIPRGLDAQLLADKAFAMGLRGQVYPSVRNAFVAAKNNAGFNDVVFVGGSTFVVAEVV